MSAVQKVRNYFNNFMTINVVATVVYSLLDNDYWMQIFTKDSHNFHSEGIYEHVY